jgi:hypothetical protein
MIDQIVLNDFCKFGGACVETVTAEANERRQIVAGAVLARSVAFNAAELPSRDIVDDIARMVAERIGRSAASRAMWRFLEDITAIAATRQVTVS